MSSTKTILVTGATGKQGGALINHLLASPQASSFRIVAVTRDSSSPGATRLASRPGVSVISGDFSDVAAMFANAGGSVWGVFSVQVNADDEEQQGKAMVDAAVLNGAQHFVYASSDRGGPAKSNIDPTNVKNFAAKYNVEKYLVAQATLSPQKMAYTILRPVTFLENISADIHGKGFTRMWEQLGTKKLQVVSTTDIGWFGAQSFLFPEQHHNAVRTLAGDELTQPEANAIFRDVVGLDMPIAPCVVAKGVKFVLKDTVGDMFRWFAENGYGASIKECRAAHPEMMDFRAWAAENRGKWVK